MDRHWAIDSGYTATPLELQLCSFPLQWGEHMIALISGVGYATNTFQRETILDNATVTVSRNGKAENGADILIVGKI